MTDEEIKEYWRTAYCNEKYKKEELEKKNTDLEWKLQEVVKDNDNYQAENKRLEQENRLLGERCNQLLKDKGELTDQITDIKANCDLAIEGRDIKIKELELELTVQKDLLQEETNLHLHAEEYIKSLEQKLEQTEKDLADHQFNYPTIKELEQENAELKGLKDVATLIRANNDTVTTLMQLNNMLVSKNQQLTKATDHIKQLLDCLKQDTNDPETNYYVCQYMDKAEQFIKEIEK